MNKDQRLTLIKNLLKRKSVDLNEEEIEVLNEIYSSEELPDLPENDE